MSYPVPRLGTGSTSVGDLILANDRYVRAPLEAFGCDRYINNSCADFRQSYRRLLNLPFSTRATS